MVLNQQSCLPRSIATKNTNKQLNSHGLVANMQSIMCRKINVSSNKSINRNDLKYDNDKNDCVTHVHSTIVRLFYAMMPSLC